MGLQVFAEGDEGDEQRGGLKESHVVDVHALLMQLPPVQHGDDRVDVGRVGAQRHQHIHVGRAAPQRAQRARVEVPADNKLRATHAYINSRTWNVYVPTTQPANCNYGTTARHACSTQIPDMGEATKAPGADVDLKYVLPLKAKLPRLAMSVMTGCFHIGKNLKEHQQACSSMQQALQGLPVRECSVKTCMT